MVVLLIFNKQILKKKKKKVGYAEFLGDLSPQYYPRRSQLDFAELTGYGIFCDV